MNTSELIAALKIKGSFPNSDDLFSDADFLVLLNMAMDVEINPIILKLNDEYLLQSKDYTIAVNTTYRLPTRTISIRDLTLIDGSGNVTKLDRNFEEDRSSNKTGYYLLRNSIELSSDITDGSLRMKYFARPSKLVETTDCAQITSIDTGTNTIVVSSAPSTMSNGTVVDFVQNSNPFDLLSMDQAITTVAGTTFTFASTPTDLLVGDWICIANQSPVPLVPQELHSYLVQAALVESLSSKKDKAFKDAQEKMMMMKENIINMLDPRVNNSSVKMRSGKIFNYFTSGRW
jgi:hypothetical protein